MSVADDLAARFRAAMANLPGGVAAITAREHGRDLVAVVTSLVSVSLEPATVAVVVHEHSRLASAIDVGRTWAATVLAGDQQRVATWLAEPGRPDVGQLKGVEYRSGE